MQKFFFKLQCFFFCFAPPLHLLLFLLFAIDDSVNVSLKPAEDQKVILTFDNPMMQDFFRKWCHFKNIYEKEKAEIFAIKDEKSIPNTMAIFGIEPEPIANFFLILLILKYARANIIAMFCYQTVIINMHQAQYLCGCFLYIRHYFSQCLIASYTTKTPGTEVSGVNFKYIF